LQGEHILFYLEALDEGPSVFVRETVLVKGVLKGMGLEAPFVVRAIRSRRANSMSGITSNLLLTKRHLVFPWVPMISILTVAKCESARQLMAGYQQV